MTNELAFLKVHSSFRDNKNPGGLGWGCVCVRACVCLCCNLSGCMCCLTQNIHTCRHFKKQLLRSHYKTIFFKHMLLNEQIICLSVPWLEKTTNQKKLMLTFEIPRLIHSYTKLTSCLSFHALLWQKPYALKSRLSSWKMSVDEVRKAG